MKEGSTHFFVVLIILLALGFGAVVATRGFFAGVAVGLLGLANLAALLPILPDNLDALLALERAGCMI